MYIKYLKSNSKSSIIYRNLSFRQINNYLVTFRIFLNVYMIYAGFLLNIYSLLYRSFIHAIYSGLAFPLKAPPKSSPNAWIHAFSYLPLSLENTNNNKKKTKQIKNEENTQETHTHTNKQAKKNENDSKIRNHDILEKDKQDQNFLSKAIWENILQKHHCVHFVLAISCWAYRSPLNLVDKPVGNCGKTFFFFPNHCSL